MVIVKTKEKEYDATAWILSGLQDLCGNNLLPRVMLLGDDGALRNWSLVGGLQIIGSTTFKGTVGSQASPLALFNFRAKKWTILLHHMLPPQRVASPQTPKQVDQ